MTKLNELVELDARVPIGDRLREGSACPFLLRLASAARHACWQVRG